MVYGSSDRLRDCRGNCPGVAADLAGGGRMRQRVTHGAVIDFVTPDELVHLLPRPEQVTRVRASQAVQLDANGNGQDEIFKVPMGYEFNARRIFMALGNQSDPTTNAVPLNVAGRFVAYKRSGTIIEFAAPTAVGAVPQVPGAQNWGDQQGPYLRNGEVFEVQAANLTANQILSVTLEGILRRPATGGGD